MLCAIVVGNGMLKANNILLDTHVRNIEVRMTEEVKNITTEIHILFKHVTAIVRQITLWSNDWHELTHPQSDVINVLHLHVDTTTSCHERHVWQAMKQQGFLLVAAYLLHIGIIAHHRLFFLQLTLKYHYWLNSLVV